MAKKAAEPAPEPAITKAEAIRQTLAAGIDTPAEAVTHIKSQFGLDVTPTHFSAGKSQAKKAAEAEPVQPEPTAPESTITKSQAVREAIDAGFEMPDDGIEFIRSNYGIDIDKGHFSAVKSSYKKSRAEKTKPVGRPNVAANGHVAPSAESFSKDEADLIGSMEALKPLVAAMGVEKIRRLVDLLG